MHSKSVNWLHIRGNCQIEQPLVLGAIQNCLLIYWQIFSNDAYVYPLLDCSMPTRRYPSTQQDQETQKSWTNSEFHQFGVQITDLRHILLVKSVKSQVLQRPQELRGTPVIQDVMQEELPKHSLWQSNVAVEFITMLFEWENPLNVNICQWPFSSSQTVKVITGG